MSAREDQRAAAFAGQGADRDLVTLDLPQGGVTAALRGRPGRVLCTEVLSRYLPRQRWFGAKDEPIEDVTLTCLADMEEGRSALAVADISLAGGTQRYFLPLSIRGEDIAPDAATLARVDADTHATLRDGVSDAEFASAFLAAMRDGKSMGTVEGRIAFEGSSALSDLTPGAPRLLSAEQSNATIAFGHEVILKIYRRLRPGIQPDVEVGRHLTRHAGFRHTPPWLGSVELRAHSGTPTLLAAAFAYVANQGDAWEYFSLGLDAALRDGDGAAISRDADFCARLGERTAGLHRALATPTDDPAFAPGPVRAADLRAWVSQARGDLDEALASLEHRAGDLGAATPLVMDILEQRGALSDRLERAMGLAPSGQRTRIHGDYHLGQVLVTADNDLAIIDFEGEPRRSMAARRAKGAPLRDVAGMLRSLDYAARTALLRAMQAGADPATAAQFARDWCQGAETAFLDAYRRSIEGCAAHPEPALADALLDLFLLQKVAYEISYELANRPDWTALPLAGLLSLLKKPV